MNITFSDLKDSTLQTKSKIQQKFDRLWLSVKKKQKRNEKLKREMDELLLEYNQTVLPKEKEYITPLCALLEKLTVFYSRKSLAQWQREELGEWFSESIYQLSQYHPEKAHHYAEKFQRVFCEYHDISEQALMDREDEFEDEENNKNQEQATNHPDQSDIFGFDDELNEDFDFQFNPFNDAEYEQEIPEQQVQSIDNKWIRQLFRRTAQALHPDKEQDPDKREEKQDLMSDLLRARDSKDVMTMMMLYNQYVDDAELSLVERDMKNLCQMLEQQQHQLDSERYDIIYQTPLHASLHESLYAASPKTRNKKLNQHLERVQDGIDQQFEIVEYLTNLSQLKKVLEQRADRFESMGW